MKRDRESLSGRRTTGPGWPWVGEEAKRWYILVGVSLIISILLFPKVLAPPKDYKLGDVADRDIKASHDFLLENEDLTEQRRQEAVKGVPSVYDFDPTSTDLAGRLREAFGLGRAALAEVHDPGGEQAEMPTDRSPSASRGGLEALKEQFFDILDIPPVVGLFPALVEEGFPIVVEETVAGLLIRTLERGVVGEGMMLKKQGGKGILLHDINTGKEMEVLDLDRFLILSGAQRFIRKQGEALNKALGSRRADLSVKLATELIKPNITFNKRATEVRKDLVMQSVRPFYFKVKQGEMLVREGERITREHLVKLSEQNKTVKRKEMLGRVPAMAVLIGFLISSLYLVGLMRGRSAGTAVKDLLFNAVTLLVVFLMVMAFNFVSEEIARGFSYFTPRALLFAMPVASGAMLISVFQGIGVAASFSLIASVLSALVVGGQVEFFIYFFISSVVAAHGVRNCRERGIFIKSGLKLGVVNIIMALSVEALYGSFYTAEVLMSMSSAFAGGILVGIIGTGTLPLIEMSFGYTSDIKLLELANMDHPLLQELMMQAPGTHQHSVIVSNMVEATAKGINANPLLARVAAYYHDIGKMRKPLYFVENQMDGVNRHEKLAPSMSGLILTSHVKDGVELAKEHKLGPEIIDIIRQHHGTSLITYFYEKAKDQAEKKAGKSVKVKGEDFRYPGPKPQTKEAGLVMLADVVQAASKTLVEPTAARIQGMVQKMINKVFSDGQLDECELTLKDLHEIAKSFNKTLSAMFHHRIDYPESVDVSSISKKGENGNTDQLSTADARGRKPEDKEETGEGLKRLGLS
jgi:putative nucleotidyltransferase with HDIG domain